MLSVFGLKLGLDFGVHFIVSCSLGLLAIYFNLFLFEFGYSQQKVINFIAISVSLSFKSGILYFISSVKIQKKISIL